MAQDEEEPPNPIDVAVVELLDGHAPNYPCPICKSVDWEVTSGGFLPMARLVWRQGRFRPRPPIGDMPLSVVSCTVCGYTYFVNLFFAPNMPGAPKAPR